MTEMSEEKKDSQEIWTPEQKTNPNVKRIAMQLFMEQMKALLNDEPFSGKVQTINEDTRGDTPRCVEIFRHCLEVAQAVWDEAEK